MARSLTDPAWLLKVASRNVQSEERQKKLALVLLSQSEE